MKQCYYSILDVPPDASIQEIKKSYRKKGILQHLITAIPLFA
jgi:curved DNA-binding protein CbpA